MSGKRPIIDGCYIDRNFIMNIIAGYLSGIAVASCFTGAEGCVALFLAGGIAGALPDAIDRLLSRGLKRPDVDIMPDPLMTDAVHG